MEPFGELLQHDTLWQMRYMQICINISIMSALTDYYSMPFN